MERTEPGYPVCSLERHMPSSLGPVWGLTRCFRAPPHLPTCTLDTAIQNTSGTSGKVFTPRQLSPNPASSCCFQSIPTLGGEGTGATGQRSPLPLLRCSPEADAKGRKEEKPNNGGRCWAQGPSRLHDAQQVHKGQDKAETWVPTGMWPS